MRIGKGVCLLILTSLSLFPGMVAAAQLTAVPTPDGRILVWQVASERAEKGDVGATGQNFTGRNPFAWSDSVLRKREATSVKPIPPVFDTMVLSGIIWDSRTPLAVIDDTLLAEGESINGAVVRTIFQDQVLLEKDHVFHTLQFPELLELGEETDQDHVGRLDTPAAGWQTIEGQP